MDIDKIISKYVNELQQPYNLFSAKIHELISTILKNNGIVVHSITSREKSPDSLKNKILREGKEYDDPLHDITDLAGVRIITYYPSDVDKIIPVLRSEFAVDEKNSIDKRKTDDPSIFGYVSVHLVIELSNERCQFTEYGIYKNLKCEIQVRTILQHAWAEIEHDIVYKSNEEIPYQLRRQFASLAGLLEIADREFEQLRHNQVKVRENIEKAIMGDDLYMPIDLDSLSFYFAKYHNKKSLSDRGRLILKMLDDLKVKSIRSLHDILTKESLEYADAELKKIKEVIKYADADLTKNIDICRGLASDDHCLLRYFLAIGKNFNLNKAKIAEYAQCPALENPKEYPKQRGMRRPDNFEKNRIKTK